MFKKSIGTLAIAAALFGTTCMPAFAATPEIIQQDIPTGYTEVQPRINWSGTAKLNTTSYQNITSSNNIFPDSPTVTSDANNPGKVTLRVVDDFYSNIFGIEVEKFIYLPYNLIEIL